MPLITILTSLGPILAKRWMPDSVQDFDSAKSFHVSRHEVSGIDGLFALLQTITSDRKTCIIRGAPLDSADLSKPVLRRLDVFEDRPSCLYVADVDKWPMHDGETPEAAAERFVLAALPGAFHDVTYVLQLSGSMGAPGKSGLRAHLYFWLSTPVLCQQAEDWTRAHAPQCDHTVLRPVQICYTASPDTGALPDPYAGRRLRLVRGILDHVVQTPPAMLAAVTTHGVARQARATGMVDPREKSGLVGAVCRAFTPYDLPTLFPDTFEAGSTPERFTWRQGGGSKEGCRVADNGTHALNSHATSPIGGRAANFWDFTRLHCFADPTVDEDAYEFDPTASPSYKAMAEWARAQPEVTEQFDQSTPAAQAATAAIEAGKDAEFEAQLTPEAEAKRQTLDEEIATAPTCKALEKIARRLRKTLSDADLDRVIARMYRRTKEIEGSALRKATIRGWFDPDSVGKLISFPHLTKDGHPKRTIQNLEAVLANEGITIRYDVIRKRQDILQDGLTYIRDQSDNASFAWLDSKVTEVMDVEFTPNKLRGYVCEISARNEHNPVTEWVDSKPWDGVSRLDELMATITLAPDFDPALARMIVRKWLIQAVAAAASDRPLQTRGVLVFAGGQYLGKSRWLKALLPGHEDLAILGRQLDPHQKDSIKTAISHWLAEMGELDATFKKSDIAALKAFLANDEDTIRLPYAAADSRFQRRTVFTASVNGREVLIDDSGNTRWWVLPTDDMRHDHTIDMQQLWAEMLAAWRGGEPHWFERAEMAKVEKSNEGFEASDAVKDLVVKHYEHACLNFDDRVHIWVERSNTDIALGMGLNPDQRGVLARIGRQLDRLTGRPSRNNGSERMRWVPVLRSSLELGAIT